MDQSRDLHHSDAGDRYDVGSVLAFLSARTDTEPKLAGWCGALRAWDLGGDDFARFET
jgi:hypothetical protein